MSEQERYDRAVKYTLENVPGESSECYFSDDYRMNEGFFQEIEDLEECCKDRGSEMPSYIWGTVKSKLSIDADDVVTSALEEWYEDADDHVDKAELLKLQEALDEFCKNCGVGDCYAVDYKVCILLDEELKRKEG